MRHLSSTVAAILLTGSVRAHEFWIEPSRSSPAPGELVRLALRVGEDGMGEAIPRNDAGIARFDAVVADRVTKIGGIDGSDPAGLLRAGREGAAVVVYGGLPSYVEIDAATFEAYLDAEGLDGTKAARSKARQSATPGRERFSRCAKALLAVGGQTGDVATRAVGLTLELVPESGMRAVRLLYRGRPLAGALVKTVDRDRPGAPRTARTDARGRAILALDGPGRWLVSAVHMVPASGDPRADWESFWASLTFEVLPPVAPRD